MAWLSGWYYRRCITISASQVDETLTNFPLQVLLSRTDVVGAQTSGEDLRFTTADGTILDHIWTGFTDDGESGAYIKIPLIDATVGATIYVYYGNATATDSSNVPATIPDYVAFSTFSNYGASYHDLASGYEWTEYGTPTAASGGGVRLSDGHDALHADSSAWSTTFGRINGQTALGVSVVVRDWRVGSYYNWSIFCGGYPGSYPFLQLTARPSTRLLGFGTNSGGTASNSNANVGLQDHDSFHVAGTLAIETGQLVSHVYHNGTLGATGSTPTSDATFDFSTASQPYWRLGWNPGTSVRGTLLEFRAKIGETPAAWLKFEYANLMSIGNQIAIGLEESLIVAGPYQVVIADSFQTDAQQAETYIPGIIVGHTYGT